jgi:hypothetical protein
MNIKHNMIHKLRSQFSGSLDRIALKVMAALAIATVLMLAIGDRSTPYVRSFSWQDRQVGAEDAAFVMSFSRAMAHPRVEAGLLVESGKEGSRPISEVLPGKVSWSGKKLFYTINRPVPYGNSYRLRLEGARAADNQGQSTGRSMEPFTGKFTARPRRFAFIGADKERRGRLMLATLGQPPQALTPADLVVKDFRFLPEGQGLIFSAAAQDGKAGNSQQIYRWANDRSEVILDNRVYQNVKFDLTPDGKILVVQRVNAKDPNDFGIWAIEIAKGDGGQRISQGGSFMVTPDGGSIAVAEGQGVAIKPLQANAKALDFLPKFGMVLGFSPNGNAAVMQKFNDDYTRSLFLVTNQGEQKELLKVKGEIQGAQFGPKGKLLYVIIAEATGDPARETQYSNQPYLMAISLGERDANNIPANKAVPLLKLQTQQGIAMSLAPDGRALLFDQLATGAPIPGLSRLTAPDGQDIQAAELWLLPLPESLTSQKIQPESLSLEGFAPRWAP